MSRNKLVVAMRTLLVLTLLTGLVYPVIIFGIGQIFFPEEAQGSLIRKGDHCIGSKLIAQKFQSDRYFHSRPSSSDYATLPARASNWGPTSNALKKTIAERRRKYGARAPADLLTSSASGLDPHLSPAATLWQMDRVAQARKLTILQRQQLEQIIAEQIELPQLGFLGPPRVNILRLNLRLDREFK